MNATDLVEYAAYTVGLGFAFAFFWNFLFSGLFTFLDFFEEKD